MNEYRYHVYLQYDYNGTPTVIDSKNINTIIIDYKYDLNHMPTIYIDAYVDKNIVDDMIKNSNSNKMLLMINKYINNASVRIEQTYIRQNFIYFMTDNVNYNNSLDYSKDTTDSKDMYRKVLIGMINEDSINSNKIVINDVIRNSTLLNTIVHYMKNMKLLIEPVNNVMINNFIVPPINSLVKLMEMLDQNFSIYQNSKYRLFFDFDKTYLLSSEAKGIPSIDETYNSVILKIEDSIEVGSKFQGMDVENNSYVINIGNDNISVSEDKATSKTQDGIMTIGNDGSYAVSATGDKYKIERSLTNNLNSGNVTQSDIDNNKFSVEIIKKDVDTSIFTLNKAYFIQNYPALKDNNGSYLLSRKREIYTVQDQDFICTDFLSFRKNIS